MEITRALHSSATDFTDPVVAIPVEVPRADEPKGESATEPKGDTVEELPRAEEPKGEGPTEPKGETVEEPPNNEVAFPEAKGDGEVEPNVNGDGADGPAGRFASCV
jgi:hypothetical protein